MAEWKSYEKQSRRWCEPDNLSIDSYINWNVNVTNGHDYGNVKIADCNRSIELGFSVDEEGLHKISRIIEHLSEFRDAIKTGMRRVATRPEK